MEWMRRARKELWFRARPSRNNWRVISFFLAFLALCLSVYLACHLNDHSDHSSLFDRFLSRPNNNHNKLREGTYITSQQHGRFIIHHNAVHHAMDLCHQPEPIDHGVKCLSCLFTRQERRGETVFSFRPWKCTVLLTEHFFLSTLSPHPIPSVVCSQCPRPSFASLFSFEHCVRSFE